jgi:hypothetical protein
VNAGVGDTTAVDVLIGVAAISVAADNIIATVLVFRFATCPRVLVVTPVAMVTVHSVPAERVAVAAVKVIVAVEVPELLTAPVNEVDPQPLVVGVDKEVRGKSGNTSKIVSAGVTSALDVNRNVIDVAVNVTGSSIVNTLFVTAEATTSVDVVIAVAAIFVAPTSTTAAVLVFRLAACAVAGVVIPLAIFTVHCARAPINAVAAVNVTAAVAAPEFEAAAVKVVDPQPLIVGVAKLPRTKFGSTIVITSPTARTAFNANVNVTDVLADVAGSEMLRTL